MDLRAIIRRRCGFLGLASSFGALVLASRAVAGPIVGLTEALTQPSANSELGTLSISLGLLLVALTSALLLVRNRSRSQEQMAGLTADLVDTRARLQRAETLLAIDQQVLVAFGAPGTEPEISGDLSRRLGLPPGRRILGFGTWLAAEHVTAVERLVETLRNRGEGFDTIVPTRGGAFVQIEGRALGGSAVLRIRDVSGDRLALAKLQNEHERLVNAHSRVTSLLESLPQPVWLRDASGGLVWANSAYGRSVDAESGQAAVARAAELLDSRVREEVRGAKSGGQVFRGRVPVVVGGHRRIFDVLEAPSGEGSAGIAIDVSDLEDVRADLVRRIEAHRRTLDELATAVAIFNAQGRLVFHNQAYQRLWGLDPAFLEGEPDDAAVLDALRAKRMLPEQADFRGWRNQLFEAYRSLEPREHWWYLPDGRTIRVVQTPNPEGGVTYLFDDVSERLALESRYNALTRVQTETLDHLSEGVAVFGSDGRLKLHNPALVRMWGLPAGDLDSKPHAEAIFDHCRRTHDSEELWAALKSAVTALPDGRVPLARRIERADGFVIDLATVPLPDGATLVTFADVTASVAMERALIDRNEALEEADRLKTDFVKHVSYELRSPLTNIIGFTQLLGDPGTGPLNDRQREYSRHILDSSAALLAIINDILDLASIDAGAMELNLGEVDIRATMEAAAEGVRDRLNEGKVRLEIRCASSVGRFVADERRVRQVLFNLLSNAIGFSGEGDTVTLTAERTPEAILFRVTDHGRGIAPELVDKVFDRFESHTRGSRHRGAGLGLSIVRSFVELHGGTVKLDSLPDRGTTVTCVFPLDGSSARIAAE